MNRLLSPLPLAAVVAVLALVGLLAYAVLQEGDDTGIDQALADGRRPAAPELTLPRLDGAGSASLSDHRGKVVVLNFWASWCDPCRDEAPLLERWHRQIAPRGGTVLGVDALDSTGSARGFVRRYGLTYPNVKDASGEKLRPFGVSGYPETFVLDRRGRIAALVRGPVTEAFLAREVLPLLAERT
ncbi:MAG TPA: TlpA disulfide reductase family protein [Thermoleophilaceae bacterium]